MNINRDVKDVIRDLSLITKEINKLDKIEELIGRKGWYSYDEFVDNLQDILNIGDYEIEV